MHQRLFILTVIRRAALPIIGMALACSPVRAQGIITTLAGNTTCSFSGDGGPAAAAAICGATGIAADSAGNIYFSDRSNLRIRKIGTDGNIITVAGNGSYGNTGDGGPATSASLEWVSQVAVFGSHLCFGDPYSYKVRCVDLSSGTIQSIGAGTMGTSGDGGSASAASFLYPEYVAFDDAGNMYISDSSANSVRRVDGLTGIITMFAGPGPGYCCAPLGDGGPAVGADLYQPRQIFARNGGLYIADSGNFRVRRVDLTTGIITTVAGNGSPYNSGDGGPAVMAGLNPGSIAVDPSGNLFIGSAGVIRMVDPSGMITTIAGENGVSGWGQDDVPATQTAFSGTGLGWDPVAKRLLIGDLSRLRQIFFTPPTTTTLTSSANPAVPGDTVTFQAAVSPSDATGSVRFYNYSSLLGSAPVIGGVASFSWTAQFGTFGIRAVYGGDFTHNLSQSATLNQVGQDIVTTTTLTSSVNPSVVGQSVTFTSTVTPPDATGNVVFWIGGSGYQAPLINGVSTYTTSSLPTGTTAVSANYSRDARHQASWSPTLNQVVKTATTTTLAASPNPASVGTPVTLTATVSPATATGTVQFFNGATLLGAGNLTSGQAQLSVTNLPAGSNSLTAVYAGDANSSSSTSAVVAETVSQASSTTVLSAVPPSPVTVGQTVSLTASVSPSAATGTVQFLDGTAVLGTASISGGAANLPVSGLSVGTHSLTAVYSGDSNYLASTSSVLVLTVSKVATTVTLSAGPNPAPFGSPVTIAAGVTPKSATGTVQFLDGATPIGSAAVTSGSASLVSSSLTVGDHSITAVYSGDAGNSGSTSAVVIQTIAKAPAGFGLSSSLNPSAAGQSVTFTAALSPASATGTVQFLDGTAQLGTATISGGSAVLSIATLAAGAHSISAVYSGDANYLSASGGTLIQTVKPVPVVTMTATPNPATDGQTITLAASLSPSAATGTVTFFEGLGAQLGTVPISGGAASLVLTPQVYAFAVGTHSLRAAYNGDSTYAPGSSASVTLTVNARQTTTLTLTSSLNPSIAGQSVTFRAKVSPTAATGTVRFVDGTTTFATVTLAGGAASTTLSTLSADTHMIFVVYSGDSAYAPSTSDVMTQTVAPAAPSHLAATASSSSQINLSWQASPTSGVTYNVYASATSKFTPSGANRIAAGISGTSYSDTGLAPSTTRYYVVTAQSSVVESAPSNQANATTTAPPGCHVTYRVTSQWNVGFGTDISIQNTGGAPVNGWQLTWTWGGNQAITQAWNSVASQNGANANLTNASWNSTIGAGATISGIGFNASYSGTNPTPTAFYLNGTLCK